MNQAVLIPVESLRTVEKCGMAGSGMIKIVRMPIIIFVKMKVSLCHFISMLVRDQ